MRSALAEALREQQAQIQRLAALAEGMTSNDAALPAAIAGLQAPSPESVAAKP